MHRILRLLNFHLDIHMEKANVAAMSGEPGATQSCSNASYNYGMGRFFQRPSAFDCMQVGVPMGASPYSYPSYLGDWGLVPGPYSHGFNFNRSLGINNATGSGFFSVPTNSREFASSIGGLSGSSNSAFSSTGLGGSQGAMGPMCNSDPYRAQCGSPASPCPSSAGSDSSPSMTTMEAADKKDYKHKDLASCAYATCRRRPFPMNDASQDDLVRHYFRLSFTADEIIGFLLFVHNIVMSRRTLCRILRRLNLRRYRAESSIADIFFRIHELHRMGFHSTGYRSVWRLLRTQYGIHATQETVRICLRIIDGNGVDTRQRRRLLRRVYVNQGPNSLIHIDGYDKLKPFGIAIHGAIDGYSRNILWLTAVPSNNNPRHIAFHFINFLKEIRGVPGLIRSDHGTENVLVRAIQVTLWMNNIDDHAGERSYSYGWSTMLSIFRALLRCSTTLNVIERFAKQTRPCSDDFLRLIALSTKVDIEEFSVLRAAADVKEVYRVLLGTLQ